VPFDIASQVEAHPVVTVGVAVGAGLALYVMRSGGGASALTDLLAGLKPAPRDNVVIGADAGSGVPPETPSANYVSGEMLETYYRRLEEQIRQERADLEQEIWRQQAQNYNGGPSYGEGGP
jgi:hypothetical protein